MQNKVDFILGASLSRLPKRTHLQPAGLCNTGLFNTVLASHHTSIIPSCQSCRIPVKKGHLKRRNDSSIILLHCTVCIFYWWMKQHSYVVGRKKYPKCTVYAGTEDHPSGFVSVQDACNWPTVFLSRLARQFGDQWLCHRLQSWRWTLSTAFSGIGAPESAVLSGNLMLKSYQYSLI